MKKICITLSIMLISQLKAQIVLEALEGENCSPIPAYHPFLKVTKGNFTKNGGFADPNTGDNSIYLYWGQAVSYNYPAGYHLPTREEWMTIVPDNDIWNIDKNTTKLNVVEKHQIGKKNQSSTLYRTFKADYFKHNDETIYAIRFKSSDQSSDNFTPNTNDNYRIAYRYRHSVFSGNRFGLVIDAIYLGSSNATISDISNAGFWADTKCMDTIILLEKGYYEDDPNDLFWVNYHLGGAWFWLDTQHLWWTNGIAGFNTTNSYHTFQDTIRLFKD